MDTEHPLHPTDPDRRYPEGPAERGPGGSEIRSLGFGPGAARFGITPGTPVPSSGWPTPAVKARHRALQRREERITRALLITWVGALVLLVLIGIGLVTGVIGVNW